jgi:subtilase family serine protease
MKFLVYKKRLSKYTTLFLLFFVQAVDANTLYYSHGVFHKRVCTTSPLPNNVTCHAHIVTDATGKPLILNSSKANSRATNYSPPQTIGVVPYGPNSLSQAYLKSSTANLTLGSPSKLVAIIDAYGYGTLATDIAYYRQTYNLPSIIVNPRSNTGFTTCGGSAPCLTIVNLSKTGLSNFNNQGYQSGWDQETALDLQMVSAICPKCSILLVQANSPGFADMIAAETVAANAGAIAISNSYGGPESPSYLNYVNQYNSGYNWPNIAITVSAGDVSDSVDFPASSPTVTAVGGTSLQPANNNRGFNEVVWYSNPSNGTGSGCSKLFSRSSWQSLLLGGGVPTSVCSNRIVADVSAIADPAYGVSVYYRGAWYQFGGTSAASPIVASIYAQAYIIPGGCSSFNSSTCNVNKTPYSHTSSLNYINTGANGSCGNLLCNAGFGLNGYNGPTGLGTPNGVNAFAF